MDWYSLWWIAALTTGAVGSLHCVGMCGPLAMALPVGRLPQSQRRLAVGLYHGGRVTAYAGLGLLMGTFGQGLLLVGLQRPVSVGAGLFLLLWILVKRGKLPGLAMGGSIRWMVRPMSHFLRQPTPVSFTGLGFLNGLLPCGFVYVALTGAIATGHAGTGAVYMGLFGLGTVPALIAVRVLPGLFPAEVRRRFTVFMPLMTVALAILLLVRGLYKPVISETSGRAIPMCHGSPLRVETRAEIEK